MSATFDLSRRWVVPEVVQVSQMDCGPATLKSLLNGFRIPVSFGRLRESCQTSLDGTSIDVIEWVANDLGVQTEQVMLPLDHALQDSGRDFPAIVVMSLEDGSAHFVVVWRRLGPWLQIMDPAMGRRWVRATQFKKRLLRHTLSVAASDWRAWASEAEFTTMLHARIRALGVSADASVQLVQAASQDPSWFALGALDAAVRLSTSLRKSGAVTSSNDAFLMLQKLWQETCAQPGHIFAYIPPDFWSVAPDPQAQPGSGQRLAMRGAVMLRALGRRPEAMQQQAKEQASLKETLAEPKVNSLALFWQLLKNDGALKPMLLMLACLVALGTLLLETLLLRSLVDIASVVQRGPQAIAALLALASLLGIMLCLEWPILLESLRQGRRVELRLRMSFLQKLPQLSDRYFHSRTLADMAERSQSLQALRMVPSQALQLLQASGELVFTLIALWWIDPKGAWGYGLLACIPILMGLASLRLLGEKDLQLRQSDTALNGHFLDCLKGLLPIRSHHAQQAVLRVHELRLMAWTRICLEVSRLRLTLSAIQAFLVGGLLVYLVLSHFGRNGTVLPSDLLLVYWALKMPGLGSRVLAQIQNYPAQRNVMHRLIEPLSAPIEKTQPFRVEGFQTKLPQAAGILLHRAKVVLGGHQVLHEIDLRIAPGEHVALVGDSGAGKSSLLGVLLGWNALASGQCLVDGQSLSSQSLATLRRETAWVDPAIALWNKSLLDNLMYARPASGLADLSGVLQAAQLMPVLERLPQGLQSYLGEAGGLLSGGEGQRVRLARALAQSNSRLVLLDEPFRGLDRGQRTALMTELRQWWRASTLLCITHDVSETLRFERVLVLKEGNLVQDGDPARLMDEEGPYQQMLQAETTLRTQLWQGHQWRRVLQ